MEEPSTQFCIWLTSIFVEFSSTDNVKVGWIDISLSINVPLASLKVVAFADKFTLINLFVIKASRVGKCC